MPYSSLYNHATSELGAAIIASFFEDAPRVPAAAPHPETLIICQGRFEGPQFSNPQDQSRGSESEESDATAAEGEVHSSYGTPCSPTPSTFSFDIKLYVKAGD
jgi:hypothetical protein